MISKTKLKKALDHFNAEYMYSSTTERVRYKGEVPEDTGLVSPFPNTFISEKNIKKWEKLVESFEEEEPKKPEPSLEEILKKQKEPEAEEPLEDLTKEELLEYADLNNIKVDRRSTKENLIKAIRG